MVTRLGGGDLVLSPLEAARIVLCLDALERRARLDSARLPADVRRMRAELAEGAGGTGERQAEAVGDIESRDEIDTASAARQLGISPRGVRQLVQRGHLAGRLERGRLLVSAEEVEARASATAARRAGRRTRS